MTHEATPEVATGFLWASGLTGRVLRARPLATIAPHLFTTRDRSFRGASAAADDRDLAGEFQASPDQVVFVKQVHGRRVVIVRPDEPFETGTEADAIVSIDPARVVCVGVADCVPILIAAGDGHIVAAIHAGWRGACAGVIGATVRALTDAGANAGDLVAAIGPSIGPCCYQVDDRVRNAFLAMTPDAAAWFAEDGPGHWKLDLWQASIDQLINAGVPAASIATARFCTADHLDTCFSYRKEGAGTGRMVAAIRCVRT